jgi:HEAT repeat protein
MTYLPPLAPTLAAALRDVESHDPARRLDAAERLWAAEEEDQRVLPALRTLASDPVGPVRQAALHALVEAQDADATPLFRAACEDPDHFVCHVALRGLVAVQAPEARTLVDDWLTSEFTDRRRTALWCLKDGWVESCRDLVLQALDDDESSVRATAAGILTELADPCTADALNSRLLDIVPLVRRTAATALARLGDQRATPALLEALDDRAHRLDIIEALGELGDPAAIPALLKLAGGSRPPTRSAPWMAGTRATIRGTAGGRTRHSGAWR